MIGDRSHRCAEPHAIRNAAVRTVKINEQRAIPVNELDAVSDQNKEVLEGINVLLSAI